MDYIDIIEKFNPYHDKLGKFTTSDGAHSMTVFTRDPNKQYLADRFKEKKISELNELSGNITTPKNVGKTVDWEKEFSKVKSFSDVVSIIDNYFPGALDIAKRRAKRKFDDEGRWDDDGNWQDVSIHCNKFTGDIALSEVYKLRGYNKKPDVVSTEEFDKMIAEGSREFFRGFDHSTWGRGNDLADEFVKGDTHFPGLGIYGSGTYATRNGITEMGNTFDALKEAQFYSKGAENGIVRFTLAKDAKIMTRSDFKNRTEFRTFAEQQLDKYYSEYDKAVDAKMEADPMAFINGDNIPDGEYERYEDASYFVENIVHNNGIYAALRGYDAIDLGGNRGYNIILNRGKVIADEQKYT